MAKINVNGRARKKYKAIAEMVASSAITIMGFPSEIEVDINFISEKEIKRLNSEFRQIDKVTDVLSFPSFEIKAGENLVLNKDDKILANIGEAVHFGDMAICLKQTKRQAKEYGVTVEQEIKKLVIHSILHLMGYDHIKDEDYLVMKEQEEKLDKLIKEKIYGF